MDKVEQFIDLFIEVWKNGISGINISEIIIALTIFFVFLLLRGLFAKFFIKRLEKYVSKTTNRFDNSLVDSLKGPTKFFPIVIGFFIATSYVSLGESTENFIDNDFGEPTNCAAIVGHSIEFDFWEVSVFPVDPSSRRA